MTSIMPTVHVRCPQIRVHLFETQSTKIKGSSHGHIVLLPVGFFLFF